MKSRYRIISSQDVAPVAVQPERDEREAHRDNLYQRLEQGYERIERGLADGSDVTTWEDFWVSLLHEYEQVCDEIQRDLAA
jgi:hypothetical protein